jgi:hypothetical protein
LKLNLPLKEGRGERDREREREREKLFYYPGILFGESFLPLDCHQGDVLILLWLEPHWHKTAITTAVSSLGTMV